MNSLGEQFTKWRRVDARWLPALWPNAGELDGGDPIPPAGTSVHPPEWMPYPTPRSEVVERANSYLSARGKEPIYPYAIDRRGLGRVGYEERQAAILVIQARRRAWIQAFISRGLDVPLAWTTSLHEVSP